MGVECLDTYGAYYHNVLQPALTAPGVSELAGCDQPAKEGYV
jgi:hypothetical protein